MPILRHFSGKKNLTDRQEDKCYLFPFITYIMFYEYTNVYLRLGVQEYITNRAFKHTHPYT